jgi:O-methyltransferase
VKVILKRIRELLRRGGYDLVPWRGADPSAPPVELDAYDLETVRVVLPYTMTSPQRLYALIKAVRYVARAKVPGDIVECGVWRGGSMMAVARTLLRENDTSRNLYLFDTFEGMPPPSKVDVNPEGQSAESVLRRSDRSSAVWAHAALDEVKRAMAPVGYDAGKTHYVKGKVEDTIPAGAPQRIALLRLDTDWFESTWHEMVHLYPRLSSAGVLLLDDYGWWRGARKAVDKYLTEHGVNLLLNVIDLEGRIAVKVD